MSIIESSVSDTQYRKQMVFCFYSTRLLKKNINKMLTVKQHNAIRGMGQFVEPCIFCLSFVHCTGAASQ